MKNKYIWLYENLDKYKYNTKDAKLLCEEYKRLGEKADPNRYAATEEIKSCYDNFVRLFNNNPYDYKCGFSRFAIETEDLDAGFILSNGEWFPVGYYQSIRPVESAILAVNKTKNDRTEIKNDAPSFMNSIEKATERAQEGYRAIDHVKKASYIRGVLFLLLGLWAVISSVKFFFTTDVINIIKNTKSFESFLAHAGEGMEKFPLLPFNSGILWIIVALIYLLITIIVITGVKKAFREIKLARKKQITKGVGNSLRRTKTIVDKCLEDEVESTYNEIAVASMRATNCNVKRGRIAYNVMNTVNSIETSHDFIALPTHELRALKNSVVYLLAFMGLINCFAFDSDRMGSIYSSLDDAMFEFKVSREYGKLRSRKMAQCVGEFDAPVYESRDINSKIKYYVPMGNKVDIVSTITENDQSWCKIKYITDTEFIEGWVMKDFLSVIYEHEDVYENQYPSDVWASSVLNGSNGTYYPENTLDYDQRTSWQYSEDEDPYGEKSITYEFDEYVNIDAILVSIGNGRSESYYYRNRRPENVTVKFSAGDEVTYNFEDTSDYQLITLSKTVNTQRVTIIIDSTYSRCPEEYAYDGLYSDVCINEVEFLKKSDVEEAVSEVEE